MRLINANLLSESIWDNVSAIYEDARCAKEDCLAEIEAAPTVDAVPVVYGQWDENGYCTNCGRHAPFWAMSSCYYKSRYCPNCGAKMDLEALQ